MSPSRKALIAITSASAKHAGGTTGLFVSEALHPYNVLVAAGFEVDLASETGKYTPDTLSLTPDFLNGEDLEIWNNTESDFRKKLDNMRKAADLDGSQYGLFYASAGHAALIDYPTATSLQNIAEQVWANGGIVSSVCHGPAIFANIKDKSTGKPIIEGRRLTGFTTEAEKGLGLMDFLEKELKVELVEGLAARLGATCKFIYGLTGEVEIDTDFWISDERSDDVWGDYSVVDGRLVTGQNPASATSSAKAAVEAFNKL